MTEKVTESNEQDNRQKAENETAKEHGREEEKTKNLEEITLDKKKSASRDGESYEHEHPEEENDVGCRSISK